MSATLQKRLDLILERVEESRFLNAEGVGNEVGFWIFDYPPEHELQVREHIEFIVQKLNQRGKRFAVINLFEVIVSILQQRNILERAFTHELKVGTAELKKLLKAPLSQEKVAQYVAQHYPLNELDFVIISGLGSAWPLMRGHEILSAMQDVMGHTPLLMFYPGTYSGLELKLFGKIPTQNYYRAFKLVPEKY
ncbi:MAG: DUF1788 domain-containing protein [Thiomicrospira sp.]|jgi:hypothetical protein|nr:DUF1788 domain-containing protein [Thiomicrospira sp.]